MPELKRSIKQSPVAKSPVVGRLQKVVNRCVSNLLGYIRCLLKSFIGKSKVHSSLKIQPYSISSTQGSWMRVWQLQIYNSTFYCRKTAQMCEFWQTQRRLLSFCATGNIEQFPVGAWNFLYDIYFFDRSKGGGKINWELHVTFGDIAISIDSA